MTIVVIKSAEIYDEFAQRVDQAGGTITNYFKNLPRHFHVSLPVDHVVNLCGDLISSAEDGDTEIEPSFHEIEIDDTLSTGSWALARIVRRRAPWKMQNLSFPVGTFFDSARDGTGVDIYIMDSGVRTTHAEFGGRAEIIYEYVTAGPVGDDFGHGTSVASCAGGATTGCAKGANIFSVKISTSSSGSATSTSFIAGIDAVLDHYSLRSAPAVVNVSYAFSSTAGMLTAVAAMIDAGIVVCGSAGNDALNLESSQAFPGEADDAICVAATSMVDTPMVLPPYRGTSYGPNAVTICAPGHLCYVAAFTGDSDFRRSSGTSFSSPYTAGVIACMLQGHAKLSGRTHVQAVKSALLANATTGRVTIPDGGHVPIGGLPDRILYLSPTQSAPEPIEGLT